MTSTLCGASATHMAAGSAPSMRSDTSPAAPSNYAAEHPAASRCSSNTTRRRRRQSLVSERTRSGIPIVGSYDQYQCSILRPGRGTCSAGSTPARPGTCPVRGSTSSPPNRRAVRSLLDPVPRRQPAGPGRLQPGDVREQLRRWTPTRRHHVQRAVLRRAHEFSCWTPGRHRRTPWSSSTWTTVAASRHPRPAPSGKPGSTPHLGPCRSSWPAGPAHRDRSLARELDHRHRRPVAQADLARGRLTRTS